MVSLAYLLGGAYFLFSLAALAEISTGWFVAGIFFPPIDLFTPFIYQAHFGEWPMPATLLLVGSVLCIFAAASEEA